LDRCNKSLDVLRPRKAVIAIFDQRQHDIIAGKSGHQLNRMPPGHIGILHALQNVYRTAGLYQPAE
jgi:hypothetical protein